MTNDVRHLTPRDLVQVGGSGTRSGEYNQTSSHAEKETCFVFCPESRTDSGSIRTCTFQDVWTTTHEVPRDGVTIILSWTWKRNVLLVRFAFFARNRPVTSRWKFSRRVSMCWSEVPIVNRRIYVIMHELYIDEQRLSQNTRD